MWYRCFLPVPPPVPRNHNCFVWRRGNLKLSSIRNRTDLGSNFLKFCGCSKCALICSLGIFSHRLFASFIWMKINEGKCISLSCNQLVRVFLLFLLRRNLCHLCLWCGCFWNFRRGCLNVPLRFWNLENLF